MVDVFMIKIDSYVSYFPINMYCKETIVSTPCVYMYVLALVFFFELLLSVLKTPKSFGYFVIFIYVMTKKVVIYLDDSSHTFF
jgi:hypothetical protein